MRKRRLQTRLFLGDLDRMIAEGEDMVSAACDMVDRGEWPDDVSMLFALIESVKEMQAQRRWLSELAAPSAALN
jgi:hypothetical protein